MINKKYNFVTKKHISNIFVNSMIGLYFLSITTITVLGSVNMNSFDEFKSGFNGGIFFTSKEFTDVSKKMLSKTESHKKISNNRHIKSITFSENPFDSKIEITYHSYNRSKKESTNFKKINQLSFKTVATSL